MTLGSRLNTYLVLGMAWGAIAWALGLQVVRAEIAGDDPQVTDEDRNFWAFRAPISPPLPIVSANDRVRTPIDAFLLLRQEAKGLTFSADASRVTLIRRAYLDLVGLPPPPQAVESFVSDTSADAYEGLIDCLLDSPHYGERWGRHWLDCAGYTDSPHCDVK